MGRKRSGDLVVVDVAVDKIAGSYFPLPASKEPSDDCLPPQKKKETEGKFPTLVEFEAIGDLDRHSDRLWRTTQSCKIHRSSL